MAKKAGGKKAKPQYNPFRRIAQYTVTASSDKDDAAIAAIAAARASSDNNNNNNHNAAAAATNNSSGSDDAASTPVDLTDTAVIFAPALPRAEVQLRVQFRCSVALTRGDTVTVHLPGFSGPARPFALEALPNMEGVHFASHFYAYWSGNDKVSKADNNNNNNNGNGNNNTVPPSSAAVAAAAFGKPGRNGVPPRQVLLLYCVSSIDAHTLVTVATPRALRLCCPDKLAANSSKIKIEARLALAPSSGGGKLAKQPVHACSEVRKCAVADELECYEQLLRETVASAGLSREERHVADALSREEVDQLCEGALRRQAYPVPALPWHTALPLFRAYEDAGGFVQMLLSHALTTVKARDALALHREVAANWQVKMAAVVVVEDVLAMAYAHLYRGLGRRALLACRLLTMEPADVGRVFGVTQLPRQSIVRELDSAYRGYHMARGTYNNNSNNNRHGNDDNNSDNNDNAGGDDDADGDGDAAALARCEATLRKWAVLLSTLLTAHMEVDESATDAITATTTAATTRTSVTGKTPRAATRATAAAAAVDARDDTDAGAEDTPPLPTRSSHGGSKTHTVRFTLPSDGSGGSNVAGGGGGGVGSGSSSEQAMARAVLRPPPPLYVGVRDVPAEELQRLRELPSQSWFVFPHVLLARQTCPFLSGQDVHTGSSSGSSEQSSRPLQQQQHKSPSLVALRDAADEVPRGVGAGAPSNNTTTTTRAAAVANVTAAASSSSTGSAEALVTSSTAAAAAMYVPDNSVLFELRWPVEAVELADVSAYPYNREWLLPFSTSCRVVATAVRESANELTHVVLEVVGSLVGAVGDAAMPDGDRAVATLLVRKLRVEAEGGDGKTAALAQLLYLTVQRNERRLLHPPTLLRAQYVAQFAAVQRASAARTAVETGAVVWQVCVHPAQVLEEAVVRPSQWEAVPRKYAVLLEQYFCSRCVAHMRFDEEQEAAAAAAAAASAAAAVSEKGNGKNNNDNNRSNSKARTSNGNKSKKGSMAGGGGSGKDGSGGGGGGLVVDFVQYTADYAGKGARPIRRLVERRVTHEPPIAGAALWDDLQARLAATAQQLAALNAKLGITGNTTTTAATAATTSRRAPG